MLLGFDIRIPPVETAKLWSPKRRDQFLLNPDIPYPLSVDEYVWPSVFQHYIPPTEILKSISIIPVDKRYTDQSMWLDLGRMRDCYVQAIGEHNRGGIEIAVELIASDKLAVDEFPSSLVYQTRLPAFVPSNTRPLGFDVADTGLTSGLNNTDYRKEDKERLSGWPDKLDEHGLIATLEDATDFRAISDTRNPSDAPYWVYRLWKLN